MKANMSLNAFLLCTASSLLQMEVSGGADVADLAPEDRQALMELDGTAPGKRNKRSKLAPFLLALAAPHAAAFQAPVTPRAHPVMPAASAVPAGALLPQVPRSATPAMADRDRRGPGRPPGRGWRPSSRFSDALGNFGERIDDAWERTEDAWERTGEFVDDAGEAFRRGLQGRAPDGGPLDPRDAPKMPWDEGYRWPWQDLGRDRNAEPWERPPPEDDIARGPTSRMVRAPRWMGGPMDRRGRPLQPGQWTARGSVRTWSQGPDGKRKSTQYDYRADPERFDDRYEEWPRPGEEEPPFGEKPFRMIDSLLDSINAESLEGSQWRDTDWRRLDGPDDRDRDRRDRRP